MLQPPTSTIRVSKLLHTAHGPQPLDVAFRLQRGRLLAVYGPSGAGKTTLLRLLAGLTTPDSGYIEVNGDIWLDTEHRTSLPTRRRSIGFVFQDFALFPHLTVRRQLDYALPDPKDSTIVSDLLGLMELEALQHHRPAQLSGGQQQRVALARAIARRPQLLLLDEPLSALDDEMRYKLQEYILMAHRRYGLTTVLVSHHLPEVFRLADEAIRLENGRITGQAPPAQLFAGRDELTAAPYSGKSNSEALQLTGEIVNIGRDNDHLTVTVRIAGQITILSITAAEGADWRIGQPLSISISPKIP